MPSNTQLSRIRGRGGARRCCCRCINTSHSSDGGCSDDTSVVLTRMTPPPPAFFYNVVLLVVVFLISLLIPNSGGFCVAWSLSTTTTTVLPVPSFVQQRMMIQNHHQQHNHPLLPKFSSRSSRTFQYYDHSFVATRAFSTFTTATALMATTTSDTSTTMSDPLPSADILIPQVDTPTTVTISTTSSSSNSNILSDNSKRGKVNEIDYCIAPADVSLSRAYGTTATTSTGSTTTDMSGRTDTKSSEVNGNEKKTKNDDDDEDTGTSSNKNSMIGGGLSLTRALNNASNRAVRRIILVPSWPSPDAFNDSLRHVAAMELAAQQLREQQAASTSSSTNNNNSDGSNTDAKCPVPRPILNALTRKTKTEVPKEDTAVLDTATSVTTLTSSTSASSSSQSIRKSRTDEEYVMDQIQSFRNVYGALEGYPYAEEFLYCLLSLATTGVESKYVTNVQANGIYHVAYQRMLAVLQTVGVEWEYAEEEEEKKNDTESTPHNSSPQPRRRRKIAKQLKDQDICLSVLDQLQIRNGKEMRTIAAPILLNNNNDDDDVVATAMAQSENVPFTDAPVTAMNDKETTNESDPFETTLNDNQRKKWWQVWKNTKNDVATMNDSNDATSLVTSKNDTTTSQNSNDDDTSSSTTTTTTSTSTGTQFSMTEPTMTRQLNVWSNIVLRVLLFGGDQELLVVAETLRCNVPIFQQRWYPSSATITATAKSGAGVDYINCMIQLLRNCYNNGVVTDLEPPIPLTSSFANAYERLVATAVELGSGYLKPVPFMLQQQQQQQQQQQGVVNSAGSAITSSTSVATPTNTMESNIGLVASIPKPRTAQEELGRFALLESNFRQAQQLASPSSPALYTPYPFDLVGQWEVRDEISGEIIGNSVVTFLENGDVQVPPPLEGLRWRLDPGPTHLDTCTFQVLSTIDRTILQYRGFIDRGARLEARFSKRPIRIRGSVMFQMREGGSIDYYKDMLPINYRTGTTKFVMTKITK